MMSGRRWTGALVLGALFALPGCDDEAAVPVDMTIEPDVTVDMAPPEPDRALPDQAVDMALPVDMRIELDRAVDMAPEPDMGPLPDLGPLDGAACDPRLRARTGCEDYCCQPGEFCQRDPERRVSDGRCQLGDACLIGLDAPDNGCPEELPYCHLKGASTVCTRPGLLREGDDCVDAWNTPQPCGAGLVCNNSVCQAPCDPAADDPGCPNDGLCYDISDRLGVTGGLCGPRNCDWFTGRGCEAGRKCSLVIRNDGVLVGTCNQLDGPGNADGALCQPQQGGGDNCGQGLYCTRPPGQPDVCRTLCDTGQYVTECPGTRSCEERLQFTNGVARGVGLCVINQ